jgi:hypothetical protein
MEGTGIVNNFSVTGPTEIERNDGVRQTLDFDNKPEAEDYNPMIDAAGPDNNRKDMSKDQDL